MTTDNKLLRTGSIGTAVAMICCFTPALVVLLGFAGLSAFVGWLDYGLFPILFASMGLIAYALYLRSGAKGPSPTVIIVAAVTAVSAGNSKSPSEPCRRSQRLGAHSAIRSDPSS